MNVRSDNVDAAEIAQFDAVAADWWDPCGPMRALHEINPLRLDYVCAAQELSGLAVADIGCGAGLLSEAMGLLGAGVVGVDMSERALSAAREHARAIGAQVDYRHSTVEALAAEAPGSFDLVTCMELIEHVPDPDSLVAACAQLVRPGGAVIFSTINRTPKAWGLAVLGAEYILGIVPRGTHHYAKFVRPSELDTWARASGLILDDLTGLHFDPVWKNHRLGPGVEVNYLARYRLPA